MYDYTAGEVDWSAAGLPIEGKLASVPRAQDVARTDVPTCGLSDQVGAVRERVRAAGWNQCNVVNEQRVVLGRLRHKELGADDAARIETVMESGSTTIRPDTMLESITKRMAARHVDSIVVSISDGELVGVLSRADAERRLGMSPTTRPSSRTGSTSMATVTATPSPEPVSWKISTTGATVLKVTGAFLAEAGMRAAAVRAEFYLAGSADAAFTAAMAEGLRPATAGAGDRLAAIVATVRCRAVEGP